eukprot:scaffold216639_cov33-Tisochrysis_lutea.AAC.2
MALRHLVQELGCRGWSVGGDTLVFGSFRCGRQRLCGGWMDVVRAPLAMVVDSRALFVCFPPATVCHATRAWDRVAPATEHPDHLLRGQSPLYTS